jgi:hypothetical protein
MGNRDGEVQGNKRWYDPTMHCDNECLRLGYCRFECGKARWIDNTTWEKERKIVEVEQ